MPIELDVAALSHAERYKLLIGSITPRPIAFVSTLSAHPSGDGTPNLAPYSFFNAIGADPMTVMFCPANNADGSMKDSMRNAMPPSETESEGGPDGGLGEFVVNLATEAYQQQMAATAEALPHGVSEFDFAGLTTAPSRIVRPPRLAESPVSFECRTTHVVRTNGNSPHAGNMVVGEVVWVHVAEGLINERMHVDADKLSTIGRMGGADYCRTRDRFSMPHGRSALER